MKRYATFEATVTNLNLENLTGLVNAYKITGIFDKNRQAYINLTDRHYYYVPNKRVVVYGKSGSKARVMDPNKDNKYSFSEKLKPRGLYNFKADSPSLHADAYDMFN